MERFRTTTNSMRPQRVLDIGTQGPPWMNPDGILQSIPG